MEDMGTSWVFSWGQISSHVAGFLDRDCSTVADGGVIEREHGGAETPPVVLGVFLPSVTNLLPRHPILVT
jgi:hypothetical protein